MKVQGSGFRVQGAACGFARAGRRGVSLMEVLISIFVLSVGLLGLAALIPVGGFALSETNRADLAGRCGRAVLRDVKVRRLLEPRYWSNPNVLADGGAFALDPLGVEAGLGNLGPLPRLTFSWITADLARQVFYWNDDLVFHLPQDPTLRAEGQFFRQDNTMGPATSATDPPAIEFHYSWFLTVMPAPGELGLAPAQHLPDYVSKFNVSVVVCYRRKRSADGERMVNVAQFYGAGLSGGGVRLDAAVPLREDDWIMLCGQHVNLMGQQRVIAQWYRVANAARSDSETFLNLVGPTWPRDATGQTIPAVAVVIDRVIGVYSTTIELDRNAEWVR